MFSFGRILPTLVKRNPEKGCQLKFSNIWGKNIQGLGFRKNFPYIDAFDWQIQHFEELGLMDRLKKEWYSWDFDQYCQAHSTQQSGSKSMGMEVAANYFVLLGTGVAISTMIFLLELSWKWRKT